MTQNLSTALALAEAGVHVFPAIVVWNDATQKLDKRPAISGWREAASTDPQQIARWWATFPVPFLASNWAAAASSWWILIDMLAAPTASRRSRASAVTTLRRGASVKTASGGYHLYFRQPDGDPLGNRTGILPPGIDIRGDGGWTVAPGAVFEGWHWGNTVDLSGTPRGPGLDSRISARGTTTLRQRAAGRSWS
jgi:Bifunctional DNA primase/polymerase, N-terminal